MKKMLSLVLTLALALVLAAGPTAYAFSDIGGDAGEANIMALKERGLVGGMEDGKFVPRGKMSYAQAVHLIVKGFGFNIDHIRFIKEPKASDYFTGVPDEAWYASSFIIAQLNGLPVPKDVNPNDNIKREQFAELLDSAVSKTGDYPLIKMFIVIKDADQIDVAYQGSIQRLLLMKIAKLDKDGNFYPKAEITRSEAAVMLHQALRFVEQHKQDDAPAPQETVTVSTYKVTDEVNKVTILWGEKPNPGYRVEIVSVEFNKDGTALVKYRLETPDPDGMYAQVITEAKADTYISSGYKVTTEQVR